MIGRIWKGIEHASFREGVDDEENDHSLPIYVYMVRDILE